MRKIDVERNIRNNILTSEEEKSTLSEMKGSKQEQDGSTQEVPSPSLFPRKKMWDSNKIREMEEICVNGKDNEKDSALTLQTDVNSKN